MAQPDASCLSSSHSYDHLQAHQLISSQTNTSSSVLVLTDRPSDSSSAPIDSIPLKTSVQLRKPFIPVTMSISIDNPLIFVYPKTHALSGDYSRSPLPSSGNPSITSTRPGTSHAPLFPSFRPRSFSNHQPIFSDNQIIQSSVHELDNRSTILSGSLILKFSHPKEIRKVIISLCGQSYIGFNDRPYEYQTVLAKELEVDLETQLLCSRDQHPDPGKVQYNPQHKTYILDKGSYRFHWSFILPPDLPPYERGQFGRTTHKVVAKVKLGSGLGLGLKSVGKNLPSIIFGVGHGGHEIETESYFVAITYPSGNNDDISDNLGLNLNVTELSEHLGPYTLSASSCYFTVAGLLSFKLKLTDIPRRRKIIKIYKITCLIKQQYRLISMKDKDSRTGGPAESWPPCQRRRVFVLDHSNVPNIKSVLSDGTSLGPSDQLAGSRPPPDIEASDSSLEFCDQSRCTTSGNRTGLLSDERFPSRSRSRSHFRGFLRNRTRSRDGRKLEVTQPSNQPIHSWNGLSSIKIGRRRAKSSQRDTHKTDRGSRLYASRSADGLQRAFSASSHLNQHQNIHGGASFPRDDASASAFSSCASGSRKLPDSTPSPNAMRHSVDSGGSSRQQVISGPSHEVHRSAATSETGVPSVEQPLGSAIINTPYTGRQQEIQSGSAFAPQRKQNCHNQNGPKWRPGRRRSSHLSCIDQDVPLVTLTDEHKSWEIEHMGRLPTDDIIRPSTNPGTQTNIHIFHTLLFEISYSVEDDKSPQSSQSGTSVRKTSERPSPVTKKVLSIRKPVQISSCCCMAESMVLPPYSKLDPNAEIVQHPTPSHAARMLKCVCDTPTDILIKTQNPKNPQANSNANGQVGNDQNTDNASLVTNSTLTFRSSNTNPDQPSNDQDLHLDYIPQNCGINHLNNSFISAK